MPETDYADLSDNDLLGLHGSIGIVLAYAEPLIAAGSLPAADWGLPAETLAHLHNQTGAALEARGLLEDLPY